MGVEKVTINAEEAKNIIEDLWKKIPEWRFVLSGLVPAETPSPLTVWEKEYVKKIRSKVEIQQGDKAGRKRRDDIEFNWANQLRKNWKAMVYVIESGKNKKIQKLFSLLSAIEANYAEYKALERPEILKAMDSFNLVFAKGPDVSLDNPRGINVQDRKLARDFLAWVTDQTVQRPEMLASHLFRASIPSSIRSSMPDVLFDKVIVRGKNMVAVPSRTVLGLIPDLTQVTSKKQVEVVMKLKRLALMAQKRVKKAEYDLEEMLAIFNAMSPEDPAYDEARSKLAEAQTEYRMAVSAYKGAEMKLDHVRLGDFDPENDIWGGKNPALRHKGRMAYEFSPGSSYFGDKAKGSALSPSDLSYPSIGEPSPVVKSVMGRLSKFKRANKRPEGLEKTGARVDKIAAATAVDGMRTIRILQKNLAAIGLKFSIAMDVQGNKRKLPKFVNSVGLDPSQRIDFEMAYNNSFTAGAKGDKKEGHNPYTYPHSQIGKKPRALSKALSSVPNTLEAQKAKLFAKQFGGGRPMTIDALAARIERAQSALKALESVVMTPAQREEAVRNARLQIEHDVDLFVERAQDEIQEARRVVTARRRMTEDRWDSFKKLVTSLFFVSRVLQTVRSIANVPQDVLDNWARLSMQYNAEMLEVLGGMESMANDLVLNRVRAAREAFDKQGRGKGNFGKKIERIKVKTAAEIQMLANSVNMQGQAGSLSAFALTTAVDEEG